ncbi:hypothetical protein [Acinetobacter bereziniae]|uniref:hypothetical protein n=1 Tax=Acinetobacter bereziniae TaxID=106648 RepID=UPI0021D196FD|nr:hypothetical protein [Acinetobacter bereziniae]
MAKQSNKLTAKTVNNLTYDPESSNKHADGIDPAEERSHHRDELRAKLENTFEKFATE